MKSKLEQSQEAVNLAEEAYMNGIRKGFEMMGANPHPKISLICVTKQPEYDGANVKEIVMVNIQHIVSIHDWDGMGTKLTLTNGEHLLVEESIDEILEHIDE